MNKTLRISVAQFKAGKAAVPTEAAECVSLMQWAHTQRFNGSRLSDVLVHIPNGAYHGADRKSGAVVARKLREQGLQPGVFDYLLAVPIMQQQIPGLWLEMKRLKGGIVSEDQLKFKRRMTALGWRTEICKGWVVAAQAIENYLTMAAGRAI